LAQVTYSIEALKDLERIEEFLADEPRVAAAALLRIFACVELLSTSPEVGRPVRSTRRELVISRGKTGYLALYEYDPMTDRVRVLRIRHQREAGYPG
jgi:plasmid stabilization system protein ParE